MAAPRALIFDLDGTLVDSLADISVALGAALADHGLARPASDRVRAWVGGGARQLVDHALAATGMAGVPVLADRVYASFQAHYVAAPVAHSHLYAGLASVLDDLVAAGATLAVLTNKPHALAEVICAHLLARWPFAAIAGHRAGEPLKPDPTSALRVAAELGVPARACAYIGDAPSDVATAHAAGMLAVAVSWGYRTRAELAAAHPAHLIDSPAGLLALGPR